MSIDLKAAFIEVRAEVRYWEDASINGVEDSEGKIPFRNGDTWEPVIDLRSGSVKNWPAGVIADIHYKVCDAGEYWLQDSEGNLIATWLDFYVPNSFLCHGDNGYGDYIIMKVNGEGKIARWKTPNINLDEWEPA